MIDPKSITELKPGSNYLIVYNRGDMPKEGVRALSEELSRIMDAAGVGYTAVIVPDGCSVEVSEVPSSAEVLALLRSVEWEGSGDFEECPRCHVLKDPGPHAPGCALDAMIKRLGLMPSIGKDTP